MPLAGRGRARTQPIWADDVADCVLAALERPGEPGAHVRYELAGPDVLTHREVVEAVLRAARRRRRLLPLPAPLLRPLLRGYETLTGPAALATWDEAELLAVTMRTPRGIADAEALGVHPRALPRCSASRPRRRGAAAVGRPGGLELRGELQQRVLAERLGDDLGVGRQPVLAEARRDRDRGLAGDVEERREGREGARSARSPPSGSRRARRTRRSSAGARPARG